MVIEEEKNHDEPLALNIGYELSMIIQNLNRQSHYFQMQVQDELMKIVTKHKMHDEEFGDYLIISNLGILFEPELKLNVCDVLKRISQNTLLILLWSGVILPDRLCNISEQSEYNIKRSEINYEIL